MEDKKGYSYIVENVKEILPQYVSNNVLLMVPALDVPTKKYYKSYNIKMTSFDILMVSLKEAKITINPQNENF